MTKPVWNRSGAGNFMLSCGGLRAVVFPTRDSFNIGGWNFNVLGLPGGVAWGPGFAHEESAIAAAEAKLAKHAPQDWQPRSLAGIWQEYYPATTAEELKQAIKNTAHHLALLDEALDSGTIEERDEVEATLHHIRAMRHSIKEMKQVLDEVMGHKIAEET